MARLRLIAATALLFAAAAQAQAETRIFMIDSSDGYGIDRCLASGEPCGRDMAAALCQANNFTKVVDFGRMDPTEITGAVPAGAPTKACTGSKCPEKVAITCSR